MVWSETNGLSHVTQATPANWPNNHESIDAKGWAFLLPTVTPEDAEKVSTGTLHKPALTRVDLKVQRLTFVLCAQHFPEKKHCAVPSGIDYLRLTPVDKLK